MNEVNQITSQNKRYNNYIMKNHISIHNIQSNSKIKPTTANPHKKKKKTIQPILTSDPKQNQTNLSDK
jgi:hypothetical protein